MAGRRCPVCRGALLGVWGEAAAPNRRYCSQACRQQAYRERATTPAERRRAAAARRTAVEAVAGDVERLAADLADQAATVMALVDRRAARLTYHVEQLAALVDRLRTVAVDYDRAAGATWPELADAAGVDESTLRRRQRRDPRDPDRVTPYGLL